MAVFMFSATDQSVPGRTIPLAAHLRAQLLAFVRAKLISFIPTPTAGDRNNRSSSSALNTTRRLERLITALHTAQRTLDYLLGADFPSALHEILYSEVLGDIPVVSSHHTVSVSEDAEVDPLNGNIFHPIYGPQLRSFKEGGRFIWQLANGFVELALAVSDPASEVVWAPKHRMFTAVAGGASSSGELEWNAIS
jgi:hypothetical protein